MHLEGGSGVPREPRVATEPAAITVGVASPTTPEVGSAAKSLGPDNGVVTAVAEAQAIIDPGPPAAATAEYEWDRIYDLGGAVSARSPNDLERTEAQTPSRRVRAQRKATKKAPENAIVKDSGRFAFEIETADIIVFFSGLIALIFTIAMVIGKLPVNEGTLGVVGFSGLQSTLFGIKSTRKKIRVRKT